MGQYYKAAVLSADNESVIAFQNHGFSKLMEHSYIFNDYVNSFIKQFLNNTIRMAWVGDYAKDDEEHIRLPEGSELLLEAWDEENSDVIQEELEASVSPMENPMALYIVNISKGLFISFFDYCKNSLTADPNDSIIHPLPLLTALGNGLGGGDYNGINMDLLGTWAGDQICICDYDTANEYIKFSYDYKTKSYTSSAGYDDVTSHIRFKER